MKDYNQLEILGVLIFSVLLGAVILTGDLNDFCTVTSGDLGV